MCIAEAIIGAAAIGAVGSVAAGSQAASATQNAANTAAGVQYAALGQQSQLSAPYRALGTAAIPTLEGLLGIGPGGSAGIQKTLQGLPGYQFQKQQGNQATVNQATAMGLGLSGNTLQGLSKFNSGLADSNYQQYLGDVQNAVGIGQAAAAGQAANIGNAAGNLSNIAIGQGQNLAGIQANEIAGVTKAIGGGLDNYVMANTLQNLGGGGVTPVSSSDWAGAYGDVAASTNLALP